MDKRLILGIIALSLVLVIGASGCGSTPSYNYGNAPSASQPSVPVATPVATPPATTAPVTRAATVSNVASPVIPPAVGAVSVATIDMMSYTFIPDKVTINVGDTVTWINDDHVDHKIQSDTGLFSSPSMGNGEKYERTFLVAGSYPYHCAIHPLMVGTIVVQ